MSQEPRFKIGDELFTREPSRFVARAQSIIGHVVIVSEEADGVWYLLEARASVPVEGSWPPRWDFPELLHVAHERDLGWRGGTPLSQVSGRPGQPGFDLFCAIAASWGYD